MPSKKLTKEQKQQVIELARQGLSTSEVARQLGVSPNRVGGIISSARNAGILPKDLPFAPPVPLPPTAVMPPVDTSTSGVPSSQPQVQAPTGTLPVSGDGYEWSMGSAPGTAGGYSAVGQTLYFQVERLSPKDGVLGTHHTSPTDDELGRQYGEGTYRITKFEGGKAPAFRETILSRTYGAPKFPRASGVESRPERSERPEYPQSRVMDRLRALRDREEEPMHRDEEPLPPRPRPLYERPYAQRSTYPQEEPVRNLGEFARHGGMAGESIVVTALEQMGKTHAKTIDQMKEERTNGPQTMMTDFFTRQQGHQQKQWDEDRRRQQERGDEERKREEQHLQDERDRRDQERKDEDRRWERRQDEEAKKHDRELGRIKEEAKLREDLERQRQKDMLELYDKRMELAEKAAAAERERMKSDLERSQKEAKEDREKLMEKITELSQQSSGEIAEMKDDLQEELKRERENLKKEHSLREQAMNNEHALKKDMLDLEKKMLQNGGQDELTKMLGKLGEGVERTIKEVVDLKKVQAVSGLSPEAQAAQIVKNADANVQAVGQVAQPGVSQTQPTPEQAAATATPGGNGHSSPLTQGAVQMDRIIKENMSTPLSQEILKEWGKHVEVGNDPTLFANMYMEWMRDEGTPQAAEARKACGMFATYMSIRGWKDIYETIKDAVATEQQEVFQSPEADVFYEGFRTMVVESVRDYWKSYLAVKQAEREAAAAARAQATAPKVEEVPQESAA